MCSLHLCPPFRLNGDITHHIYVNVTTADPQRTPHQSAPLLRHLSGDPTSCRPALMAPYISSRFSPLCHPSCSPMHALMAPDILFASLHTMHPEFLVPFQGTLGSRVSHSLLWFSNSCATWLHGMSTVPSDREGSLFTWTRVTHHSALR